MGIGASVRRAFGPWERQVSQAWRAMFIDMADWTRLVQQHRPDARRILEVGCGEGAGTEQLLACFPDAQVDAIDVADNLGRLFSGDATRVAFRQMTVEELAAIAPASSDLVVLCDVLHHVPAGAQESLLHAIRILLKPDGVFAMKDWERNYTPIYWLCWFADRFLTGDRIRYKTPAEARAQLEATFGASAVARSRHVRPWRTNYTFFAGLSGVPRAHASSAA